MKKNVYKLDGIDCRSCGLKIEDGVNKLNGVQSSSMDIVFMKFFVNFDENIITDEEIELGIHKSLNGVKIIEKNSKAYEDTYEEPRVFKKIIFGGRKRNK